MTISFLNLKPAYEELREECDAAYHRVMNSGWYLLGEELRAFEAEYAAFCGSKHCMGVANGLDGLQLALRATGIGPGDEVIVPAHTFIATWFAVTSVGATIVPVEPKADTFNLDPDLVEQAVTHRTRAIIPVHLYGQTVEVAPLFEIANRHDLIVLEDAAQSHGARYCGRVSGSLGHIAAHSFYPAKNLGAIGDAGAVTTDNDDFAHRIRELRNYGGSQKYHHDRVGYNSRMDELQAAFLRVRLRYLSSWNTRRRQIATTYLTELAGINQITLPVVPEWAEPVWHLFVIQTPERDRLKERLDAVGVATIIHYPIPPHLSGAYRELGYSKGSFPIAERIADSVLSLPIGPHLSVDDARHVVSSVKSVLEAVAID